jgi:AcrR family transcriptional regulator
MAEGDVRNELLAAGERAFAARGYAATTVDDVIRESSTSRASFYRYFSGKEQLFEELSRACFREMRAAIRAVGAGEGAGLDVEIGDLLLKYRGLNERYGGVIRAWTELTVPADSPMQDRSALAVRAMFDETAALLARVGAASTGQEPPTGEDPRTRAALLFLLVERSSFYVSNRVSRIDPGRLLPTLTTLVERGYLADATPP